MSDDTLGRRFKRWFWRPPRAHGEVVTGRTVSVLELFYDLVTSPSSGKPPITWPSTCRSEPSPSSPSSSP